MRTCRLTGECYHYITTRRLKQASKGVSSLELFEINQEQCIQCGICAKVCPVGALSLGANGIEEPFPQACISCGHCVAVCPTSAIDNKKHQK